MARANILPQKPKKTTRLTQTRSPTIPLQLQHKMSSNTGPSPAPFIARFYGEDAKDFAGRTLDDILNYDNRTLESKHNFIQVLFPVSGLSLTDIACPP